MNPVNLMLYRCFTCIVGGVLAALAICVVIAFIDLFQNRPR